MNWMCCTSESPTGTGSPKSLPQTAGHLSGRPNSCGAASVCSARGTRPTSRCRRSGFASTSTIRGWPSPRIPTAWCGCRCPRHPGAKAKSTTSVAPSDHVVRECHGALCPNVIGNVDRLGWNVTPVTLSHSRPSGRELLVRSPTSSILPAVPELSPASTRRPRDGPAPGVHAPHPSRAPAHHLRLATSDDGIGPCDPTASGVTDEPHAYLHSLPLAPDRRRSGGFALQPVSD